MLYGLIDLDLIKEEKQKLRVVSKTLRKQAFKKYGMNAPKIMAKYFKSWVKTKKEVLVIAFYFPIKTEVDPFPLVHLLHGSNLRFCLPIVRQRGHSLVFREWSEDSELITSSYGAKVPAKGVLLIPNLIITPLLAFDQFGSRLGYGGGFYDRTIGELRESSKVIALGLAFESQKTDSLIPTESTDQKIDYVLTEKGVKCFNNC